MLLALRGKPLPFLHVYHHAACAIPPPRAPCRQSARRCSATPPAPHRRSLSRPSPTPPPQHARALLDPARRQVHHAVGAHRPEPDGARSDVLLLCGAPRSRVSPCLGPPPRRLGMHSPQRRRSIERQSGRSDPWADFCPAKQLLPTASPARDPGDPRVVEEVPHHVPDHPVLHRRAGVRRRHGLQGAPPACLSRQPPRRHAWLP